MRPKNQGIADHRGPAGAAGGVCLAAIAMPASEVYVAFARLATAHLGTVVGLSVGRVADLRLAVDEACGQFLRGLTPFVGTPTVPLALRFDRTPEALRITVSGPMPSEWPDRDSLSWLVLDTLVADACCKAGPPDGVGTLTFSERLGSDEASGDESWFTAP